MAASLQERGHQVAVLSRRGNAPANGIETIHADRKNADSFASAIGSREFDVVVDLCAYQPEDLDAVMPALRGRSGHYLFISTDFVYSSEIERFPIAKTRPRTNAPPTRPASSRAKRCCWTCSRASAPRHDPAPAAHHGPRARAWDRFAQGRDQEPAALDAGWDRLDIDR
jgi:nucleoside-diphosphate-sugar epimerase